MLLWIAIFLPLMIVADAVQLTFGGRLWPMLLGNFVGLLIVIGFRKWWKS